MRARTTHASRVNVTMTRTKINPADREREREETLSRNNPINHTTRCDADSRCRLGLALTIAIETGAQPAAAVYQSDVRPVTWRKSRKGARRTWLADERCAISANSMTDTRTVSCWTHTARREIKPAEEGDFTVYSSVIFSQAADQSVVGRPKTVEKLIMVDIIARMN